MCLEDLRTLYTAIYDHLDNKEEGIAYAKKHLAYVNDIGDADADATAAKTITTTASKRKRLMQINAADTLYLQNRIECQHR